MASRRHDPSGGEHERFRLLTGFNDIFVTIGVVLILLASAYLGGQISPMAGGAAVAVSSWLLAEYFTRRLRLSLSSIVLLLGFAGGALTTGLMFTVWALGLEQVEDPMQGTGAVLAGAALAGAGAYLHWRRFMVPITVAAGTVIGLIAVSALILTLVPSVKDFYLLLILAAGLTLFLVAMYWDAQDRERATRRSDVAFWLHLAAAPLIIHPVFTWVGVQGSVQEISPGLALATCIATYLVLGLVSLAIDRRAMLVSALAYVIFAMSQLFSMAGTAAELNFALAALVIGSALLLLSARWDAARRLLLPIIPGGVRDMVPVVR